MRRTHRGVTPSAAFAAILRRVNRPIAITLTASCLVVAASVLPDSARIVGPRSDPFSIEPMSGASVQSSTLQFTTKELSLPGANGLVTLDYFAWDGATRWLWIPAGSLASVVVIGANDEMTKLTGFHTEVFELRGKGVILGPTSVSVGKGVVYVGNRADSSICAIDARTLRLGNCIRIASPSDGIAQPLMVSSTSRQLKNYG